MIDLITKNPVAFLIAALVVGIVLWFLVGLLWPIIKMVLILVGLVAITSWLYKALTAE